MYDLERQMRDQRQQLQHTLDAKEGSEASEPRSATDALTDRGAVAQEATEQAVARPWWRFWG
jgi:hypothetical protein